MVEQQSSKLPTWVRILLSLLIKFNPQYKPFSKNLSKSIKPSNFAKKKFISGKHPKTSFSAHTYKSFNLNYNVYSDAKTVKWVTTLNTKKSVPLKDPLYTTQFILTQSDTFFLRFIRIPLWFNKWEIYLNLFKNKNPILLYNSTFYKNSQGTPLTPSIIKSSNILLGGLSTSPNTRTSRGDNLIVNFLVFISPRYAQYRITYNIRFNQFLMKKLLTFKSSTLMNWQVAIIQKANKFRNLINKWSRKDMTKRLVFRHVYYNPTYNTDASISVRTVQVGFYVSHQNTQTLDLVRLNPTWCRFQPQPLLQLNPPVQSSNKATYKTHYFLRTLTLKSFLSNLLKSADPTLVDKNLNLTELMFLSKPSLHFFQQLLLASNKSLPGGISPAMKKLLLPRPFFGKILSKFKLIFINKLGLLKSKELFRIKKLCQLLKSQLKKQYILGQTYTGKSSSSIENLRFTLITRLNFWKRKERDLKRYLSRLFIKQLHTSMGFFFQSYRFFKPINYPRLKKNSQFTKIIKLSRRNKLVLEKKYHQIFKRLNKGLVLKNRKSTIKVNLISWFFKDIVKQPLNSIKRRLRGKIQYWHLQLLKTSYLVFISKFYGFNRNRLPRESTNPIIVFYNFFNKKNAPLAISHIINIQKLQQQQYLKVSLLGKLLTLKDTTASLSENLGNQVSKFGYTFFKKILRSDVLRTPWRFSIFLPRTSPLFFNDIRVKRKGYTLKNILLRQKGLLEFKIQPSLKRSSIVWNFFLLKPFKKKIFSCNNQLLLRYLQKLPCNISFEKFEGDPLLPLARLFTTLSFKYFTQKCRIKPKLVNTFLTAYRTNLRPNQINPLKTEPHPTNISPKRVLFIPKTTQIFRGRKLNQLNLLRRKGLPVQTLGGLTASPKPFFRFKALKQWVLMKMKPRLKRFLNQINFLTPPFLAINVCSISRYNPSTNPQYSLTRTKPKFLTTPFELTDNIFYFIKSISSPLLFKYILTNKTTKNSPHHLTKNFFKTMSGIFTVKQLNSFAFASRKQLLTNSNFQPVIQIHASIKKHIFYRLLDSTFTVNVIYWYHKLWVEFIESCSGRKALIRLNPSIEEGLTFNDLAKCSLWEARILGFRRLMGPKIFIIEALHIVCLSLRLKDPTFLANWIRAMVLRLSFWKHRLIFRYIRFLLRYLFQTYFDDLNFRGIKIQLKGKISVAGNARTRTLFFKFGKTSQSSFENKIAYDLSFIETFTGIMGFKVWFFY